MANGAGQGAASGAASGLATGGLAGGILGALIGGIGGELARRESTKARRRQRRAIAGARRFADEVVGRVTGGELFSSARDFLTSTFADAAGSPLARDFAKRIAAEQSVRGTFGGNLGAIQSAVGTSAFAQQLRQSLLPSALQFAQAPELLRQSVLGFEAPLRVAAATGGQLAGVGPPNLAGFAGTLNSALAGGLGGFQIGRSLQTPQRQQQEDPTPGRGGLGVLTAQDLLALEGLQGLRRR